MKYSLYLFLVIFMINCRYSVNIQQSDDSYYGHEGEPQSDQDTYISHNSEHQDTSLDFSNPYIYFNNPSFEEGQALHSTLPLDWSNCRKDSNSPPDLHSNSIKHFRVTQFASNQRQFVGLVVRSDGTKEHIGQRLEFPLKPNNTYAFNIDLSLSEKLISLSRFTMKEENFKSPCILKVYGASSICDFEQLLCKTSLVNHYEWQTYTIQFIAKKEYDYLILSADFHEETPFEYDGNLMIDNLSPIIKL